VISPAPREPEAARPDRATAATPRPPASGTGAPAAAVAGAFASARHASATVPATDALQRALADAVARRAADAAAPPPAEGSAVLARARKKRTRRKQTARKPATRNTSVAAGQGVRKPATRRRKAEPAPVTALKGARRSTRTRTRPGELGRQIHWAGPAFGAWDDEGGGTSVRVDLGPAAGLTVNYGSVPVIGECTAVESLNAAAYAHHIWIKGHLLNDNLGGQGQSPNLTPMTHTANMRYKRFESSLKNAIDACYRRGQFIDRSTWYGVRVAIDVVGQQWPHAAEDEALAVAHHVSTAASYITKVGAGAPAIIAQPAWAPALVTGNFACVV
jgi:hypothetical protein